MICMYISIYIYSCLFGIWQCKDWTQLSGNITWWNMAVARSIWPCHFSNSRRPLAKTCQRWSQVWTDSAQRPKELVSPFSTAGSVNVIGFGFWIFQLKPQADRYQLGWRVHLSSFKFQADFGDCGHSRNEVLGKLMIPFGYRKGTTDRRWIRHSIENFSSEW